MTFVLAQESRLGAIVAFDSSGAKPDGAFVQVDADDNIHIGLEKMGYKIQAVDYEATALLGRNRHLQEKLIL